MISAVVVNWNGRHYLEECLAALLAQEPPPAEVILVDNHSDDGSREFVGRAFPGVRVLDTGHNRGPAAARNFGVSSARHGTVLLLDNDVVLRPGALAALARSLAEQPGTAAVQARSLCADRPDLVHYDAADLHYLGVLVLHNWFQPLVVAGPPPEPAGAVVALCILVDRDAWLRVGGHDEELFILFEDNELSWKLRLAGYRLRLCAAALCVHRGGTAGLSLRESSDPYPARRTFLHSRNRPRVLLACMHWRTLLLTLPAQLLYGFVHFGFALRRGHVRAWLRGKWDLLRGLPALLRRRRRIQALRVVPDRAILIAAPLTLNPTVAARTGTLRRCLDAAWIGYWRVVRRLCG